MTKGHIEFVLSGYGVPFTDALADKLLEMFDEEAASYQHTINELNKVLSIKNKGEWIPIYDRWGDIVTTVCGYECSKCGEWNADNDDFCPNCGADMRGKAE